MAAASLLEATRLLSPPLPRPLPLRCGLRPLVRPLRLPVLRAHRRLPSPATAAKGEEHPAKSIHALSPLDALRRSVLDALAALRRPALALLLASALLAVGIGFGGSGFLLTLVGFAAFLYLAGFLSDSSGNGSVLTETQKTTVLKLQVGLLGIARSFQKELDQIAEKADTSTPAGLGYVLTETTLALLRHPDCCISAYSSVDVKRSMDDGERRFNQLSIEERGKFDEETLVNVNSIKRNKTGSQRSSGFSNEYIVITLLVAAEGVHKLPVINSSNDMKTALQNLAAIPANKILAVEVLWTPQNENDTLSERELLEDYPLLRPL